MCLCMIARKASASRAKARRTSSKSLELRPSSLPWLHRSALAHSHVLWLIEHITAQIRKGTLNGVSQVEKDVWQKAPADSSRWLCDRIDVFYHFALRCAEYFNARNLSRGSARRDSSIVNTRRLALATRFFSLLRNRRRNYFRGGSIGCFARLLECKKFLGGQRL